MNWYQYQNNLYNDLMNLVNEPDSPFYMVNHTLDDCHYRVFNYRLASYSDFLKPSALEARGIMFEVIRDHNDEWVMGRLASLTPSKFFNNKENPLVMNVDFNKTELVMDKADGSLMSTFMHDGRLLLKSKTSLTSEQANAANAWLNLPKNRKLLHFLITMDCDRYTVSLEWVSPTHRIVLGYDEPNLIVHGARYRDDGSIMAYKDIKTAMTVWDCDEHLIKDHFESIGSDNIVEWVNSIPSMTDNIEGYVIFADGVYTKHKTDKYCSLHHTKDSVNSDRRLYEAVVNEAHDDLRAMFADDTYALGRIDDMEAKVKRIYRDYVDVTVQYVNDNKDKDRKTFAIDGQKDLPKLLFGITMSQYLGKPVDFKEWLIKNFKELGIKDDAVATTTSDEDE